MNVFVLTCGRSGSGTFYEACKHIENYTVGFEQHTNKFGLSRFIYPNNHIEVDCRLAWFLGRLHVHFPKGVLYVYLRRNFNDVANSWDKRWYSNRSLIAGYTMGILQRHPNKHSETPRIAYALDLVNTVDANISHFIENKNSMEIQIDSEDVEKQFYEMCNKMDAKCNFKKAIQVLRNKRMHSSKNKRNRKPIPEARMEK